MERVGVELLVEGLSAFMSNMKKADNAIRDLVPGGNLVSGMFGKMGDVISGFVGGALRVLEYTLGNLAADAIEAVISALKKLISEIITAGSEFQTLSIRLNGLNMPKQADGIKDWTKAMADAEKVTKEQLTWIQQLSAATPFDAQDVANAYTLARSYGFTDLAARRLTKDITDFTAGMGLSGDHIERVIQNLGQMVQRGKITSTEIRDLARGAFLPLDDVLGRVAEKMGVTLPELMKQISKPGEGVPAQQFIDAFQQMVESEPRFIGAAGRLGRTFEAAKNNVLDLFRSIGGLNIVKPVLDVLGEKVASIVDQFVSFNEQGDLIKTEKWDKLVESASRLGAAISNVLSDILGLLPTSSDFVDGFIKGLDSVSSWLTTHRGDIVRWVQDAAKWINTTLIPSIMQLKDWLFGISTPTGTTQGGALQSLAEGAREAATWIGDKLIPFIQNALMPLLASLVPLVGTVANILILAFTGTELKNGNLTEWITLTLIPAIKDITESLEKNRDTWVKVARAVGVILVVFIVAATIITTLISTVTFLASVVAGLVAVFIAGAVGIIAAVGLWVGQTLAKIIEWRLRAASQFQDALARIQDAIKDWAARTLAMFGGWVNNVIGIINSIAGINIPTLVIPVTYDFTNTINDINQQPTGGNTPRRYAKGTAGWEMVPPGFRENYMIGMSSGERFAVVPSGQSMPASPAMNTVNASQQIINNLTLQIHSSAKTEPIVQDFGLMKSLVGQS